MMMPKLIRLAVCFLLPFSKPHSLYSHAVILPEPVLKKEMRSQDTLSLDVLFQQIETALDKGDADEAVRISQTALDRARAIDHTYAIAKACYQLGIACLESKKNPEAKTWFQAALEVSEKKGYLDILAGCITYLGFIRISENDIGGAYDQCQKALTMFQQNGNRKGEALALYHLSQIELRQNHLDPAIAYVERALTISRSIHDLRSTALYSGFTGGLLGTQGQIDKANAYFIEALDIWTQLGNKKGMSAEEHHIGAVYFYQGRYPDALTHYLQALRLRQETGNIPGVGDSYHDIGNIYLEQGEYEEALHNYQEALEIFTRFDNKQRMAMAHTSIGNAYSNLGMIPQAIDHFETGLRIKVEIQDLLGLPYSYNNLTSMYMTLGDYPKARSSALATRQYALLNKDWGSLALSYLQLGRVQIHDEERAEAAISLDSALYWAEQSNYAQVRLGAYQSKAQLDSINQDFKSAFIHYKLFKHYSDSIIAADKENILRDLKVKYEVEKKDLLIAQLASKQKIDELQLKVHQESLAKTQAEKERIYAENLYQKQRIDFLGQENMLQQLEEEKSLAESKVQKGQILLLEQENQLQAIRLKRQTQLKYYMILGILFLSLLSYVMYSNIITRQKLKLQTLRNKIASDLHDDVGSTLSSIAIFSEMAQQQSREVIPLLDTITASSRQMLDAMADIVWTINPENDQFEKIILRMKSYAYELLGARQIGFDFNTDPDIASLRLPMDVRKNLFLIFKEATINLAKYSNAENALFSLRHTQDQLVMTIRDNGKGFDLSQPPAGNGINNMKKRALEIGADLIIESMPMQGTSIQFTIAF